MPTPTLHTEPPLPPAEFPLRGAQLRIGRAVDAAVRLDHPLVDARHAVLLEREDGWWITAPAGRVQVNGTPLVGEHRLAQGDRLTLAPGAVLRYDSGAPAPLPPPPPSTAGVLQPSQRKRWRRRFALPRIEWHHAAPWVAVLLLIALVGGGGWYGWRVWTGRADTPPAGETKAVPGQLTLDQAEQFDSLLTAAYDHIERGQLLVEYGANSAALEEFAAGIAVITTSTLRNEQYVRDRVEALRASVADIYRRRNLTVPGGYASARSTLSLATSGLRAALSVSQFASAFASVQAAFTGRFKSPLVVTGSDHPEHLSLYGPGGALDLRSSTLSPDQLRFVVEQARAQGIRVKDFSQDSILRVQIAAAIKAGVPDRAGTGLHLHIDRFANRRDRFTVP